MKNKLQITIEDLKKIIEEAEVAKKFNASLSNTIEIYLLRETDTHTGSDLISADIKSGYQECNSFHLMTTNNS